jgi:hypothetical protein
MSQCALVDLLLILHVVVRDLRNSRKVKHYRQNPYKSRDGQVHLIRLNTFMEDGQTH